MANTAGLCSSFKGELMLGLHAFGPGAGIPARSAGVADVLKVALFLSSASRSAADTAYSTTGELAATGGYTAGGLTVPTATAPSTSGTTGIFTPSATVSWTSFTSSGVFDCAVLYNATQGNRQVSVHTFSPQSIAAGTFTLTMPTHNSTSALLRIG